jgi:hypothetical protein
MTAIAGATAAYTSSPPGRPLQSFPALSFTWDGAATPTLTVKVVSGGATCAVYSGQALIQAGVPSSLIAAAATGGNPWEVGPA